MEKHIIGIVPLVDEERESYWMLPGYMEGILAAGGLPVMLPLTADPALLDELARQCGGFLFTGGQDVSPALYGEPHLPQCGECCPARDRMERALLERALAADRPVLGICRGIQFINVVLGGTLYQDIPTQFATRLEHHQAPPYERPVHEVELKAGAPLAELLKKERIAVNSYHHQAVKTLAPGLREMARAADGLIEGVFMPDRRFVWAVQWHPEFSYRADENSRRILKAFVEAVEKE